MVDWRWSTIGAGAVGAVYVVAVFWPHITRIGARVWKTRCPSPATPDGIA